MSGQANRSRASRSIVNPYISAPPKTVTTTAGATHGVDFVRVSPRGRTLVHRVCQRAYVGCRGVTEVGDVLTRLTRRIGDHSSGVTAGA